MSINLPTELAWVSNLAVGQQWPKGDEDRLKALGQAWESAASRIVAIHQELGPAAGGVLENVGGSVADDFNGFVNQLHQAVPGIAEGAGQYAAMGKNTAVQIEYAKYMILLQLVWLAVQIAQWIFFAPEVVPAFIASARLAVQLILRRLLVSVAAGVVMNVGMSSLVQGIQILKGDRDHWDVDLTKEAAKSGAIGGAIGGVFFGVGGVIAPKFAGSLVGKAALGAGTGLTATVVTGDIGEGGLAISSGLLGALGGGGKSRIGGGKGGSSVGPIDIKVPTGGLPDTGKEGALQGVGGEGPVVVPTEIKSPGVVGQGGAGVTGGSVTGSADGATVRTGSGTGQAGAGGAGTSDPDTTATTADTAPHGSGAGQTGSAGLGLATSTGAAHDTAADHATGGAATAGNAATGAATGSGASSSASANGTGAGTRAGTGAQSSSGSGGGTVRAQDAGAHPGTTTATGGTASSAGTRVGPNATSVTHAATTTATSPRATVLPGFETRATGSSAQGQPHAAQASHSDGASSASSANGNAASNAANAATRQSVSGTSAASGDPARGAGSSAAGDPARGTAGSSAASSSTATGPTRAAETATGTVSPASTRPSPETVGTTSGAAATTGGRSETSATSTPRTAAEPQPSSTTATSSSAPRGAASPGSTPGTVTRTSPVADGTARPAQDRPATAPGAGRPAAPREEPSATNAPRPDGRSTTTTTGAPDSARAGQDARGAGDRTGRASASDRDAERSHTAPGSPSPRARTEGDRRAQDTTQADTTPFTWPTGSTRAEPAWPTSAAPRSAKRFGPPADAASGVPVRADTPARTRARADVSAARRHEQPAEARQWRDRLPAGGSRVRTERFDPKVNPINPVDSEGKVSGTLAGHQTLIRSEVRRVQAENGTWVRHHTVSLPVRLGEGAQAGDREHLQALVQQALDEHVNDRFALPRSGDQLHVAVEFRDAPKDSEQVTVSRGDHSKPMDQRNWTLDSRENDSRYAAKLVHEVFHYLGARDEEHDTDFVFRRSRESAAVHDVGLMADADDFTPILNRHLAVIEDTTDVTAMVRDHPLTADRTAVRNPEPAPEPRTHPDASDGDDERWSAARAPRGGAAPHPGHINTHVPWDPRAGAPQSGQRPAGSSAHQSRGGSPESGNWTGGEGNPPMAESPRTVSPSDSPTREGGRQNALYSEFGTPNHRGGWSDASGIRHWDADELFAVLERKLNSLPKPHMLFNVQEIVTKHTRRQFTVPQLQRLSRDYAVWRQVNGLRGKWGSDPNLKHVNELYELYKEHDHMREISLDGRIEKWLANGAPLTSRPGANAADLVRLMGLEVKHGGVHDRADFNPVPTRRVDSDPTHLAHQFSTLTTSDGAGRHSTVMPLGAVAVGRVDGPLVSWREAYGNSSARPPHYDAVSALFRMMDADRHPLNLRQLQEVLAEPGHPYVTEMQQHIFNQHGWEMTEMQVRRLNQQYIAWQKMKELPQDYNHDRDVATIEMIWRDHVSYGDLAPGWPTRHPEPGDMSPQAMVDRWLLEGKANRWTENHARDYLDILKDLGYPTGVQRRHTDGGRQAEMGSRGRASRTDPVLAGILTKIENQFDQDQLARRYYSHIPRLFETTPHLANVFKSTPELLHMVLLNPEIANKYKFASEDDLRRYSIRNFLDNHFTVRNGEAALAKYLEYIGVPRSRQESGAVRGGIYPWLLEDAKKAWTHVEANRQMQWVGAAENLRNFDQGNPGTWRFESTVKYGDEGIGENDKLYIKRHLGSLAREGLKGVELHKPREATLGNGRHVSFSFVVTESGMVSPVVHDVKSTPKELYKPSEHRLDRGIVDAIKKLGIHVGLARRDLYVDLPPEELRNMNFATFVRDAGNGYRSFDEALMAYEKGIGITYFDKRFQIGARGEFRYIWEQMHGAGSAGRR